MQLSWKSKKKNQNNITLVIYTVILILSFQCSLMFSGVSKGSTGIKTSKIQNCRSHTKLFDKKDNSTFKIIRMPNKSSNIHVRCFIR